MEKKKKGREAIFKVCSSFIRMSLFQKRIVRAIVCVTLSKFGGILCSRSKMENEFCFSFNNDIPTTSSTGKDPLLPFYG